MSGVTAQEWLFREHLVFAYCKDSVRVAVVQLAELTGFAITLIVVAKGKSDWDTNAQVNPPELIVE